MGYWTGYHFYCLWANNCSLFS